MAASDQFMSDRMKMKFLDAKYGAETPGMFRGANYVPGAQLDAERDNEQAMRLQELQNKGQTDVQGLRNVGQLDVTKANLGEGGRQFDMTNRLEGRKFGETQAQNLRNYGMDKKKFGLNKRRLGLENRKFDETKAENERRFGIDRQKAKLNEYTQLGGMANPGGDSIYDQAATGDALAGFNAYGGSQQTNDDNAAMDLSIRQAVATGQPLSEAQSIYVRAQNQGQQTQGQQTQTGVPGPMGMQGQSIVAPITPKPNQRETNESIYGSKPTLKNMWDIDAKRKAARDAKRKSQWTTMY